MPSAAPDTAQVERFRRDLKRVAPAIVEDGTSRIGVALSGGPDSCALLLLAAATLPGRVMAMTVDHGMRAEAAEEVQAAAALCAAIGVPHEAARVTVDRDGRGVQAAARAARYAALAAWSARQGLAAILTAHHADDQAETLLMRLNRGSGLGGLAGVRAARPIAAGHEALLLRPLLTWRKAELEAIVAAVGIAPARDPSNDDSRYDRTIARRILADTPRLDPLRIAQSARHLADAEDALAWMTGELAPQAIGEHGEDATLSAQLPREIVRRLLLRLFADRFAAHPDGPATERAMAALSRGETVTLADIICRPEGSLWHFRRAPPRRSI